MSAITDEESGPMATMAVYVRHSSLPAEAMPHMHGLAVHRAMLDANMRCPSKDCMEPDAALEGIVSSLCHPGPLVVIYRDGMVMMSCPVCNAPVTIFEVAS